MSATDSDRLYKLAREVLRCARRPTPMGVDQWLEARMHLPDTSAVAGRYSLAVTPYLREPAQALTDPDVIEVCGQKSSQIGWTMGLVMGWQGYTIDQDPAPMICMFPRDKTARDFNIEKFEPVVEASPALADKIEVKSRSRDYRQDHKTFPGGFIKYVGSNSAGGVKSTSAKRLIVEEPDDCNVNLRGQGDSIELLRDRGKSYADAKMLVGGTPTIKGVSSIEAELLKSDQRYWYVECHHCGEAAPLRWEQVRWSSDPSVAHPVYGAALPDTARYVCAACGAEWTNDEKNANSSRTGHWRATAPFRRIRGYYFNELMSPFKQCALPRLVERYLAAKHEEAAGDVGALIAFYNGALGLPWEYRNDVPEEDDLQARAMGYPELTVPAGGLVVTAGLDTQHDRLAIVIRAWGRGEESWLVYFGELFGNVLEWHVWEQAWELIFGRAFRHASGAELRTMAASFDSSDGQTDEAVYKAVREFNRRLNARRCMAVKGASTATRDIFTRPQVREVTLKHKAARFGLPVYMVGTWRAKDLILGGDGGGRIKLGGSGPGRIHAYRDVRPDYYQQLLSEIKAPAPGARKLVKVWQKKAGRRNEALDCEVYALHAARSLRIEIYAESRWAAIEAAVMQSGLFDASTTAPLEPAEALEAPDTAPSTDPEESSPPPPPPPALVATTSPPPPARPPVTRPPRRPGFVMGYK